MKLASRYSGGLVAIALGATGIGAAPAAAQRGADPLEGYYGNTLICAAGQRGNDLCHTWIERDGTFINIDPGGMHTGHYTRGPTRADGKTPVCYHYDSAAMVLPPELMGPPPGAAPLPNGSPPPGAGIICRSADYRSTCTRYKSDAGLSAEDRARFRWTIVERFHDGVCYPLAPKQPGDSWFEDDDPLPSQNGLDRLYLIKGHR